MARVPEIEVKLIEPITIGATGKQAEVDTVLLRAPSGKHRKLAGRLKRILASTMLRETRGRQDEIEKADKAESETGEEKEASIRGIDLVNLLASASNAEPDLFDDVYDTFFGLLKQGCGSIGGTEFTDYIFDKLSMDDIENLLGEYGVTFLLESLTRKQGGKR